ncbi:carbohydrate ABC transporter permease [Paenibacillus hexagrammi]|uniref:Sugar ABC transporter permease n=1 Tax=Paenibacillus hexagrammi TaxID=2908839 RepID=A0ABY3SEV1_9BACL|nr:sugar ABC transporter permease [Paenibacillus sp. YPD9-1]UJF32519.1 sugar ABC transporter permease [Paenibacillus sp. YPD9-1]
MLSSPVPLLTVSGLLVSLLVNNVRRGKTFYRASVFLPMMLSVSVMASIWVIFLQPYTGILSVVLKDIGINHEIFWLSDGKLAWVSLFISTLWWTLGFNLVLYLAALQDIPAVYYEAAQIEGATRWQSLRFITLPSLSRITALVVVLQTISSFKIFGQSQLITGGGPAGATKTIVFSIYEHGFHSFEMGYASAISMVLMLIIFIVSILQYVFLQRNV